MTLRVAVLGSTGSIGRQTLEVAERAPDRVRVAALGREKILGIVFNGYEQVRKSYHRSYDRYYKGK